ncbi:hypothetical protein INR49_001362 [Caranx melampygus]|nr:hypothetical protein INR49_001362 [Caranx melampygus]
MRMRMMVIIDEDDVRESLDLILEKLGVGFLMGNCRGAFQLQSLDRPLEQQCIIAAWLRS